MSYHGKTRQARILLIDDCVDAGYLVNVSLMPFQVEQAFNLAEARACLAKGSYDIFLIDAALPDGDGFKFCQELSNNPNFRQVPKILLTGRRTTSEKVVGLNSGADDYITKPFDPPELKARVDAKLRNQEGIADAFFRHGNFEFDLEFQRCFLIDNGIRKDLLLTPTEFRIFLSLSRNEGSALSRAELIQSVWKSHGTNIEKRGIDTHIRHLRQKLGSMSNVVISVYGKGYSVRTDDAA